MMLMENCIRVIEAWMIIDKLKLNDGKPELMLIGTKQQLSKIHVGGLCVGNSIISPASVAKRSSYFHLTNDTAQMTNDTAQTLIHYT